MKGLALALIILAVGVTASAFQAARSPEQIPPQSVEARKAQAEYDQAMRAALAEFERAKSDAAIKRKQSLNVAFELAMKANNLDEAIRIRSAVNSEGPQSPQTPAVTPEVAADENILLNKEWRRFAIGDHGECSITFRPNGKLDAVKTSWSGWKLDGRTLVLMKGNKEADRFQLRTDTPVFYSPGALGGKDSLILVPDTIQEPAAKR